MKHALHSAYKSAAERLTPVHHVQAERVMAGARVDAVDPLAVLAHGRAATGQRGRAAASSAAEPSPAPAPAAARPLRAQHACADAARRCACAHTRAAMVARTASNHPTWLCGQHHWRAGPLVPHTRPSQHVMLVSKA